MINSKIKKLTFFSQWGPITVLAGLPITIGIFAFIIAALKPGYSGIVNLFQQGVGYGFAAPIVLGILFGFIFCWRVRFEESYATMYYCTFFPVRINYDEINYVTHSNHNYKHNEIPVMIHFHLHSGEIKSWNINLFSPAVSKEIKNELTSRIPHTESIPKIPDIGLWANNILRPAPVVKIIWAIATIMTLWIATWSMINQFSWDKRIKNWDKVEGIILKNTTKRVPAGKRTKEVANVEYKYTYKNRQYHGTKIVYDSDDFPALKVGSTRQVIVNPENPQECAIMFWYRGNWKFLRWSKSVCFYLLSLIFAIIFLRTVYQKKIIVPDNLKNYLNSIPPEWFHAALTKEFAIATLNNIELRKKMEYRQNFRYGIVRESTSKFTYAILSVLLVFAVTASIVIPLCWIVVIIIGFVLYAVYAPRTMVFDFQAERFFGCRNFKTEKAEKFKSIPFSRVDHLCLNKIENKQSCLFIGVFAVTYDGYKIPLFRASRKHLGLLFELLPELAEKMGHLPITF